MNKTLRNSILTGITTIIICFVVGCFAFEGKEKTRNIENIPDYYHNILASPYIPVSISFAEEPVPLDVYWVRENLDKELIITCYQHSRTLQTIKRSPRFFPVIEKILNEEGVPEDFKYLCVAESGLENVVSPAKAAGYWQFLASTGKSYGLIINEEVDERYDLEKSTRAACQYLKDAKKRLGSWTMAAAAYNMGEAGVKRSMDSQQIYSYWDLYLNQEIARYIYRILAYKLVFEHPQQYGVKLTKADLYYPVPVYEHKVTASIPDLYQFAMDKNITYRELKTLNPWMRSTKLTLNPARYTIKLPETAKTNYIDLLQNIDKPYQLIGDSVFHVKKH